MTVPSDDHAQDERDTDSVQARVHLDGTYDSPALTVFRTAEWVPPAYRQAYLEGAASVLGHEPLFES